ncbi:MAG: anti-sigma factor [Reyranellaceae bacterium]
MSQEDRVKRSDGQTAAEYVLQNLPADEQAAFARRIEADPALAALVGAWERRFSDLAERLPHVRMPDAAWRDFETAISSAAAGKQTRGSMWGNIAFWRLSAVAGLLVAVALALVLAGLPKLSPGGASRSAREIVWVLTDGQKRPNFVVRYDEERKRMTVIPLDAPAEADRDMQLWLIPASGAAQPRSLGLLQPTGLATLQVRDALFEASADPGVLAVSVEPRGGSTAGAPTGPVILQGKPTLVPVAPSTAKSPRRRLSGQANKRSSLSSAPFQPCSWPSRAA